MDWESAEEIIGTVIRRARQRSPASRLQANIARDLPLIRCDAVLLVQLLDNLVDNAIKYSPAESPIELLARTEGERLLLAVRDRGLGVGDAGAVLGRPWLGGQPVAGALVGADRGAHAAVRGHGRAAGERPGGDRGLGGDRLRAAPVPALERGPGGLVPGLALALGRHGAGAGGQPLARGGLGASRHAAIGREIAPVLRQPIARIIANAETIRTQLAGPLADQYSDYAADLAAAGQHLLALIDDLSDLEVVESEDFSTAPDRIDLADVARRAAGILGVRAQERATVEFDPAHKVWPQGGSRRDT